MSRPDAALFPLSPHSPLSPLSPLAGTARHRSPYLTPSRPSRRAALGSLHNSPRPATGKKITRIFHERSRFTMDDKENRPDNFHGHRTGPDRREPAQTDLFHSEFFQSRTETRHETKTSDVKTESFFRSDSSFFRTQSSGNDGFLSRTHGVQSRSDTVSGTNSLLSRTNCVLTRTECSMDSVFGEDSASCLSSESPVARSRNPRSAGPAAWTHAKMSGESPMSLTPQRQEEGSQDSGYANSLRKRSSPLLHDEGTVDFGHLLRGPGGASADPDLDFQSLHDLEEEFDSDNFDKCTKYEIISTDSPDIVSRGRTARHVSAENFVFGAPIADSEPSTCFNTRGATHNPAATRALNFDFTSPASVRPRSGQSGSVKKALKFSETLACHPLRHEPSDSSIGSASTVSSEGGIRLRLFNSESATSMESGFVSEAEEAFLFESMEPDNSTSPKLANFCNLISGQIKDALLPVTEESMELDSEGTPGRVSLYRSVSLNPDLDKVRMSLFATSPSGGGVRPFKRPEPPAAPGAPDEEGCKRRKSSCEPARRVARPVLQRALSDNAASIMSALARSESNPELTGDFSRPCALPLTRGRHADLRCIAADTLAALLRGEYARSVQHYQVIDCRYPYEFAGGHVRGARNLHTRRQVLSLLDAAAAAAGAADGGRTILVFHCEFSLERGPKLCRFLRSRDRARHREAYPALRHPELYLLHEGYAAFHARQPALCEPAGYTPMLHPRHREELARCRAAADAEPPAPAPAPQRPRSRLLL